MTDIQYISDIHVDYNEFIGKKRRDFSIEKSADILAVVGDVSNDIKVSIPYIESIQKKYKYRKLIFVPGNHEYYKRGIEPTNHIIKKFNSSNHKGRIKILNNSSCSIDKNIVVFGTTLWSGLKDPVQEYDIVSRIQDFRQIKYMNARFRASSIRELHQIACNSIDQFRKHEVCNYKHKVLLSHFLPSYRCTHDMYKTGPDSRFNSFFCADINEELLNYFDVCIYGHSHEVVDTAHLTTLLTNNPVGIHAIGEGRRFDPYKKISLEKESFVVKSGTLIQ